MNSRVVSEGNAGGVTIFTNNLNLTNGGNVDVSTSGQGNAGTVDITATGNITAEGETLAGFRSGVTSLVNTGVIGNGGDINISAGSIFLDNNASFDAQTFGEGNAGNITVQVDDSVSLSNESLITSNVREGAIGDGGNVDIKTNSLTLTGGSQVQAAVFRTENNIPGGQGQGGNININARDSIDLSGFSQDGFASSISTITEQGASGKAGDITINTGNLRLSNGADVNAATRNSSDGGNIVINANTFEATGGGQVRATTRSDGSAGNIILSISDKVVISGSDPTFSQRLAQFGENSVSDAGATSGLFVNSTPESTGQAGSLSLNAKSLILRDSGTILASTQSGVGGNITLQIAEDISLRNKSLISASAGNNASGGNVNIDTNFIVAFPKGNNDILANANQGQGGVIDINATSLFGIQEREPKPLRNDINASSDVLGLDGTVNINSSSINPIQGATELPQNIVEPEQTTAQACAANREAQAKNGLNITGKGGIPAEPGLPLNSLNVTVNGETNPTSSIPAPIETSQGKIQPARGIKVTESGEIILTAYRTNNSGERIPEIKLNCS